MQEMLNQWDMTWSRYGRQANVPRQVALVLTLVLLGAVAVSSQTWLLGARAGLRFDSGSVIALRWSDSSNTAPSMLWKNGRDVAVFGTRLHLFDEHADTITRLPRQGGAEPDGIMLRVPGSLNEILCLQTNQSGFNNDPPPFPIFYIGALSGHGLMYDAVNGAWRFRPFADTLCSPNIPVYLFGEQAATHQAVIPHSNGLDLWIIVPMYYPNIVKVYRLTSNGIDKTSFAYDIGFNRKWGVHDAVVGDQDYVNTGEIKASASGRKVAFTTGLRGRILLFDFDPATGVLSNRMQLADSAYMYQGGREAITVVKDMVIPYGIEFSADEGMLYVTRASCGGMELYEGFSSVYYPFNARTQGELLQYDLTAGDADAIRASKQVIVPLSTANRFMGLQLGPDGRIYVAQRGHQFVSRINNPNARGVACGFEREAVRLLDSTACGFGFPFVMASTLGPQLRAVSQDVCVGDTARIPLAGAFITDSVEWDFGDTARPSATVHGRRP